MPAAAAAKAREDLVTDGRPLHQHHPAILPLLSILHQIPPFWYYALPGSHKVTTMVFTPVPTAAVLPRHVSWWREAPIAPTPPVSPLMHQCTKSNHQHIILLYPTLIPTPMASPPIYVLILLFDLRSRSFSWLVFIYEHNNTWPFILFMFCNLLDPCSRSSMSKRINTKDWTSFNSSVYCWNCLS